MDKKLLRRQLETQAAALEKDGPELAAALLDTCCALLGAAREAVPAPGALEELDRMELLAASLSLAEGTAALARPMAASQSAPEQTALEDALRELSRLMEQQQADRNRLEEQRRQLEALQSQNETLRQQLEADKEAMEEADQLRRALERMRKEYGREKLQAQEQENERLQKEIQELREQRQALESRHGELQAERGRLEGENQALQAEIQAQPDHCVRLVEQRDALAARLEALRAAEADCSPENQAALQEEIDRLVPRVETLRTAAEALRERLAALRDSASTLDREKQILESDVLCCMEGCLSGLEDLVEEHREALEAVRRRADDLSGRVRDCEALRRSYQAWWDDVRTPLERMEEALTAQGVDASSLRATLDPGQCAQVRQFNRQTEEALQALDRILESCYAACQQDQDRLENRVGRI